LNVYSFVGLIIADRPGEEERDYADRLCARSRAQEGKTPVEAIYEGCLIRFRPS